MDVREIVVVSAYARTQGKQKLLFGINIRMLRESVKVVQ